MDHQDVALFLVPNDHAAGQWRSAYPHASVAVVGSPRLGTLPERDGGTDRGTGPVVAVSFHTTFTFSPELRSAFGHFRSALPALAERYEVLGHAHPRWGDQMAREFKRLGIEYVADFGEVCRRADVYAVDNSSTLFEFAATGRPVVVLNAPWYRRQIDHGLRFWAASTIGVNADEPGELLSAVELALLDRPDQQAARTAALALVYQPREDAASAVTAWEAA
jgi:hypothetical protein